MALLASLVVPGGGFLYVGRPLLGLVLGGAVVATWVLLELRTLAVLLHLYQAFAARNEARDLAIAGGGPLALDPDAPPDLSATAHIAPPDEWKTQKLVEIPATPELDAEGFLLELGSDFERFTRGDIDEETYAARKGEALEYLTVKSDAERDRVLETVGRMVEVGALTAEEGLALEERVHRA